MRSPLLRMNIRQGKPSNGFGSFPHAREKNIHQGWDLEAHVGTAVYAVSSGVIVDTHRTPKDYGNSLLLEFSFRGKKLYALYAHLRDFAAGIKKGSKIREGEIIGHSGKTGNASNLPLSQEHLHFEIRTVTGRIPPGFGLGFRIDPGEVLGYEVYSCHY